MTRKIIGGLLLGSLMLAVPAVAFAADHGDTHMDLTFKTTAKSKKAGTARHPRPVSLSLGITQRTLSGTGQPADDYRSTLGVESACVNLRSLHVENAENAADPRIGEIEDDARGASIDVEAANGNSPEIDKATYPRPNK